MACTYPTDYLVELTLLLQELLFFRFYRFTFFVLPRYELKVGVELFTFSAKVIGFSRIRIVRDMLSINHLPARFHQGCSSRPAIAASSFKNVQV
jgi:hypothetical protein